MRRLFRALALPLALVMPLSPAAPAPARPAPGTHHAPAATASAVAAAAAPAVARPALWKVADSDTTIWLFGTIHALPSGVTWLTGPVAKALDSSSVLVTEIPQTDPTTMQSAVMAHALLPADKSLRAMLGPKDRAAFEKALTGFGLPVEAFDRFEPWYAAIALTAVPLARSGYATSNGVDEAVSAASAKLGHGRIGLETADYQLGIFDSLPMDVQIAYLNEVVADLPKLDSELAGMIREWSAGHPDKLAELLNAEQDDPRIAKPLLFDRNRNWAQWIRKRLDQPGTVFIAVGAGHLAGKNSVQDMLLRDGIKVVRVQ